MLALTSETYAQRASV